MKRAAGLTIASIFAAFLACASSYYALEVRGGSRVYAADEPVRKGRMMLFHRYPDGVYMSLAASEVEKVIALQEPLPPAGMAPGQEISIGSPLPGPRFVAPPATEASQVVYADPGYGYSGSYWGAGGYVPPRPPVPPPSVAPSRIGPNGFPILAPAGSAGSTPPPIGPNGFPVLAPQAPAPARRPG